MISVNESQKQPPDNPMKEPLPPKKMMFHFIMNTPRLSEAVASAHNGTYVLPPQPKEDQILVLRPGEGETELKRRLSSEVISIAPKLKPQSEKDGSSGSKCVSLPGSIQSTRPKSNRPTQRMRMRPWLLSLLDSKEIPGLQWVKRDRKIFSIPWKHASGRTWKGRDADLFERYAIHTGKHVPGGQPDHKRWKANFRCALNSLHDVQELQDRSMKTGEFAYKLYRFLDWEKKSSRKGKLPGQRPEVDMTDLGDINELHLAFEKQQKLLAFENGEGEESSPPEIVDHNYSYNKGESHIAPIVDSETMKNILNRVPSNEGDTDDNFMETNSPDLFPRLPVLKSSIDNAIEKVIEGGRQEQNIKSQLIIDDRSAPYISNVMEIDTSPDAQSEESARLALAKSLVSLKGTPIDDDLDTDDSSFAASILLDLRHQKVVRDKLSNFVKERMDGDAPTKAPTKNAKVTSSGLLAKALKGKNKNTANNSTSDSGKKMAKSKINKHRKETENSTESKTCKDVQNEALALDLRIKTEPVDQPFCSSSESFSNTFNYPSRNSFYRSSRESFASDNDDEDEDLRAEPVPPPAHSYLSSLSETENADLPQPLDLSLKVHNLVIADWSPPSKSISKAKIEPTDISMETIEEKSELIEPLNLKVEKRAETSRQDSISSTPSAGISADSSDLENFPLDLTVFKSEPMESTSFVAEDFSVASLGPVPDLIEAPRKASKRTRPQEKFDLSPSVVPSTLFIDNGEVRQCGKVIVRERSNEDVADSRVQASATPTISRLLETQPKIFCPFCDKDFWGFDSLSRHMSSVHPRKKHNSPGKIYQCSQCSKTFSSTILLAKHSKVHFKDGQVQCSTCKDVFKSQELFHSHRAECKESVAQPAISPQLESRFSEQDPIMRPYQCGICNEGFEQIDELKAHMEREKLPVRCASCQKMFSTQVKGKTHMCPEMSTHGKAQTHTCPECENMSLTESPFSQLYHNDSALDKPMSGMNLLLQAVERTVSQTTK